MSDDVKITIIVAIVVLILGLSITACTYQVEYAQPIKMAEQGMCWQPVVAPGSAPIYTYAPCKQAEIGK